MALDAAMLEYTARRLKDELIGARVDKIFMPTRDEALFALRGENGAKKLFISARSGASRIHLTSESFDNPAVPQGFCMLLRKYLSSGRITDVRTVDAERIVFIDFDALNEMGDRVKLVLSVEIMGRYSNMVLVSEKNRVIDALKRIDVDQSEKRQLVPGVEFTMPPAQNKMPFLSSNAKEICDRVTSLTKPLSAALLDTLAGIGPVVCREIAYRVTKTDAEANSLNGAEKNKLVEIIELVKRAAEGDGECLSIIYDDKKPVEFSFVSLTQYENLEAKSFDDVNELFDSYYLEKDRAERMKTRSSDLFRQVNSLYDRAVRKQAARKEELNNTEKAAEKRLFGELVNANLHTLTKGMKSAALLNYYTNETVNVPLDVTKTPVANSQKYYKEYKKLTTAAKMLVSLIEEGEQEISYLSSVKYEITEARTEEDFLLIRKELKEAGYLRGFKYKEQKRPRKMSEFIEYRTSDGLSVLVGRNNAANEKLTLKTAENGDLWFHVKNASGSHTVLQAAGAEPSEGAYTEAAEIAAYHSSLNGSQNIPVDYTRIKNVKKAVGQKTGMVYYESYNTAYVTPDESKIENLRVK